MKKLVFQVVVSLLFVFILTFFVYQNLESITKFWDAQFAWSIGLIVCWVIVAMGYYHQGWIIRNKKGAQNVSVILPVAVFCVQCILFVKGIFYNDWPLILGALLVNSGVLFSMYHILKTMGR